MRRNYLPIPAKKDRALTGLTFCDFHSVKDIELGVTKSCNRFLVANLQKDQTILHPIGQAGL